MNALKDRGVLVGGVKGKINGSYRCMEYDALLSSIISKFGPINIPLSTFDAPLRAFNVTYTRFYRTQEFDIYPPVARVSPPRSENVLFTWKINKPATLCLVLM